MTLSIATKTPSLRKETLSIGLALFSMFFGAGNIIFPLALGQFAGDKNFFAILGLIVTAAIMPIIGVIAMILYEGDYRRFFGRLGRIPGFLLSFLIISLLGPLGSTPRCIALAYTTLNSSFLEMSPILFSGLACFLIFIFTIKKQRILEMLGWVLTPLLLTSLAAIVGLGLFTASSQDVESVDLTRLSTFFHGLKEGYNTMDLLAAFFFSSTILTILKTRTRSSREMNSREMGAVKIAFRASLIGALLLSCVYIGFSYVAAFHGADLNVDKDVLLAAITLKIAGPYGGILVCTTIALACLTTAIALISSFTDFVQHQVFKEKFSYESILIGSLILTFFVSTFEFSGISAFLGPILQICYPGLIVLTFLNIAERLKNFKPVKLPVFAIFALSAILYFTQKG